MAYIFQLTVRKDQSRLTLFKDENEVAVREWPEARDMGRQLFVALPELLAEAGIAPRDIAEFRVESDLPDGFTSRRIAETVARVYTGAVQVKTQSPGR
jgi:hypothetical protein